jgi:hypothetical protein
MTHQVEHFIHACALCSQHKPANHKFGLYQPLPLPSLPWDSISMDFLSGLPMTLHKHDAIWVIVCCFSKMALFIPCNKTTIAAQTTDLFFHNVWPHFGLPTSIISDHDAHFLNTFWKTLWDLLGCQLKYSTAFHPQTDGQTKVVNHSLVHALHIQFSKTKQWDTTLHVIQHSYNRVVHISTGISPFEACFGYQPLAPYELPLTLQPSGTPHQQKEQTSTLSFLQNLAHKHAQVSEALKATQQCYKSHHDAHRSPMVFTPGDKVWFYMEHQHFKSQRHHKLKPLHYGPYIVLQRIGDNAYRLDFPPQLGIHDVVNVNSLKHYEPPLLEDNVTISHPVKLIPDFQPPLLQDTLLDTRHTTTHNQQHTSYLVGCTGQTPAQAKWFSEAAMHKHFPHLLTEVGTLPGLNREELGNPTNIHVNPKEGTLPQPTGFLEGSLSQLIGGQEQLGTSPKEVVDQI